MKISRESTLILREHGINSTMPQPRKNDRWFGLEQRDNGRVNVNCLYYEPHNLIILN